MILIGLALLRLFVFWLLKSWPDGFLDVAHALFQGREIPFLLALVAEPNGFIRVSVKMPFGVMTKRTFSDNNLPGLFFGFPTFGLDVFTDCLHSTHPVMVIRLIPAFLVPAASGFG